MEKCKLNMHIWTSVRIFVRNFVKWWSDKWRYWIYKSFSLNFNFEPEIRILAPESTNCWAWNFLTSQSRIKIKLWDMNLQDPNFLRAEVGNSRVRGLWDIAHASWVMKMTKMYPNATKSYLFHLYINLKQFQMKIENA